MYHCGAHNNVHYLLSPLLIWWAHCFPRCTRLVSRRQAYTLMNCSFLWCNINDRKGRGRQVKWQGKLLHLWIIKIPPSFIILILSISFILGPPCIPWSTVQIKRTFIGLHILLHSSPRKILHTNQNWRRMQGLEKKSGDKFPDEIFDSNCGLKKPIELSKKILTF